MCGIAGILSPGPLAPAARSGLTAMREALRHRGPDGQGEWSSPCGAAAFAHTRLAVFDRTAAGHQPMSIAPGRFTITYNGAIYNFAELRRSLEQSGVQFVTATDTEVILRLYEQRGSAGIAQLRGMFALAVWDEQERTGLLARDRFGIKPLYYTERDGTLIFASEVRALLRSGLVSPELDSDGVYGFFRTGSVPEPGTLLRDVKCLPAGHHATWTGGRTTLQQYWQLHFAESGTAETAVADTRQALLESVDGHFAGDAPIGLFLSGGTDSAAILALAQATGHHQVQTFALSFPGTPEDEGPLAQRTAEYFGARHHTCEVDAATARAAFESYCQAADQPSVDGLNTFVMARFAREGGVTAVLSGIGADELFGGYPTFAGVPRLAAWHHRLRWLGAAAPLGRVAESVAPDVRTRRVADMLGRAPSLANAYQTYRGIFTHREAAALTAGYLGEGVTPLALPPQLDHDLDPTPADGVSRLELTHYVRNQLLRDGDVMSMASGLELRTPFLDAGVVDAVTRLPASIRLQPGKALLRRAVPELPPWIAGQPKRCFQFPFARWVDGEWQDAFTVRAHAHPAPAETWYRQWCVFSMESWMANVKRAAHD